MKYKLIQRANPLQKEAALKWYAQPVYWTKVNQKTISGTLSEKSSLTSGDISNVIENLVQELPKILENGGIVQLGDLWTFKVSFTSEGAEEKGKFSTSKIKPKILFTPSVELKKMLEHMKYEQES